MAKFNWVDITREDVIVAIEKFIADNPEYPEPRSTFLVYEGKRLPAKHIRGMAYQVHYGEQISKNDFGGGMETVRFFERLGFEMDYRGMSNNTVSPKVAKKSISHNEAISEHNLKPVAVDVVDKNPEVQKVVIPSKRVIEQKNALQLILNRIFDGDIVCEKTYSWLKTPADLTGTYRELYNALSSYRGDTTFAKKNVTLRCDFVCESRKLVIEYDCETANCQRS